MRRAFLGHLLMMLLGYALAAVVAAAIISLIARLPSKSPDPYYWSKVLSYGPDIPGALLVGAYVAAIYAFPGWLVSVIVAEIKKEQRAYTFAAAGVLTALLALYLADMGIEFTSMTILFFGLLVGGFFGGLVYWAVAGKRSGHWRSLQMPSIREIPADETALK
jgi:hypothetical protein